MFKCLCLSFFVFAVTALAEDNALSFPKAFQGTWDESIESCTKEHSDMRLVINTNFAEYWESQGEINKLKIKNNNLIQIVFSMSGEGQNWVLTETFKLTDSANKLIISDRQGVVSIRERCL